MSKPVFDDFLHFRGRRNRRSYILVSLAVWSLLFAVTLLLVMVGASASEHVGTAVAIGWLISLPPFAWVVLTVSAQRCHDFGWSGWLAVLAVVPYVGIAFCMAIAVLPGTVGENRHGADPRTLAASRMMAPRFG